jgi:hypothetical protein
MVFVCLRLTASVFDYLRYVITAAGFFGIFLQPAPVMAARTHAEKAAERLAEIAEILAAGLVRLRARQSSTLSADRGDSSLDFARHRSGPDDPGSQEVEA